MGGKKKERPVESKPDTGAFSVETKKVLVDYDFFIKSLAAFQVRTSELERRVTLVENIIINRAKETQNALSGLEVNRLKGNAQFKDGNTQDKAQAFQRDLHAILEKYHISHARIEYN